MITKTVFQICITDNIPAERKSDMASVEAYAGINGYDYLLISELPDDLKGIDPRIASDYLRIKVLSENPYHLYVDWDVEITGEIQLGETPILVPFFDHFIYNGVNTDLFKQVLANMEERKRVSGNGWKQEEGTIYKAFRKVPFDKNWVINPEGVFVHKWNTLKG